MFPLFQRRHERSALKGGDEFSSVYEIVPLVKCPSDSKLAYEILFQLNKFDYRLENKVDTDLQKVRCRVNYHALKFANLILDMEWDYGGGEKKGMNQVLYERGEKLHIKKIIQISKGGKENAHLPQLESAYGTIMETRNH